MISCKEYVEIRKKELREQISILSKNNRVPHLGVIQIGSNDASERYVKGKKKDCEEVGIVVTHLIFKDYSSYDTNNLKQVINDMCDISNCDGIIVQLPIPDKFDVEELQNAIPTEKDVDGFRRDANNKTIKNRASKRGDNTAEMTRRIKADSEDFKGVESLADKIIYNNDCDDLDMVLEKINDYVEANQ